MHKDKQINACYRKYKPVKFANFGPRYRFCGRKIDAFPDVVIQIYRKFANFTHSHIFLKIFNISQPNFSILQTYIPIFLEQKF